MRDADINGAVLGTESKVQVNSINLTLSFNDAYALCNVLHPQALADVKKWLNDAQLEAVKRIGRDLGVFVDHSSRNNLGEWMIAILPEPESAE
jgi:hypothetical protein